MVTVSTPDIISTKTDKSKLQHGLQSHIEPTLDWPCSAAHNVDVNAVTTEHNRERSGSVVECLTRDRRVAGSSLTGVTALWSLSKTHLS